MFSAQNKGLENTKYLYGTLIALTYGMCMKTTMRNLKPTITERRNSMRGILQMAPIPKKKIVICLMAVLFTCLWAGTSFASWSQQINENGLYNNNT